MTNKYTKFVGIALAAVLLPVVASAATIEELQAQIAALMAQLSAAKPATTASCSAVFTKTLKAGMSDQEVWNLQKLLNSDAATQVAAMGVGSMGNETMFFGPATKAAVIKFQNKYASEVLAPAGLSAGTGLVGAMTRAKLNALCAAAPTTSTPGTSTGGTPSTGGLSGGAGSVSITNYSSDVDDNVVTGVPQTILGFKVKADGSDVSVSHVKLTLVEAVNSSVSNYLDRYFDTIDVYANGTKVASVKAADWNRDSAGSYSKTIALDKTIVRMGTSNQTTFAIKAVGAQTIDTANTSALWTATLTEIRFQDATGVTLSGTPATATTVQNSGINVNKLATSSDVKVKFSSGSANPDERTVFVSDSASGDKVVMNEFKIKAEGTRLSFDQLQASTTGSTSTANMFTELQLVHNGSVIDTVDPTGSDFNSTTGVATFNIDNLVYVNQDETQTFQIVGKMQKISTGTFPQGSTSTISLATNGINAQDNNGDVIGTSKFSGSSTGKTQTFRATGLNVTKVSSVTSATTNSNTPSASFGTFTTQVKVTASGDDIWVPFTIGAASSTAGVSFNIEDSSNVTVATGTMTQSVALVSGGTRDGNYVKIADGESATLEIVVTYDPNSAGQYRLQINAVGYTTAGATGNATASIVATPESDFQSSNLFITN